jgi:hypothetical protein
MIVGTSIPRARAYDPTTTGPGGMHGKTHRLRQDEGLDPADVVEMTIRPGVPAGGWVEFEASEGLDELMARKEPIGANNQGITLVVSTGDNLDPNLVRELRASSIPSRLVRRPNAGR